MTEMLRCRDLAGITGLSTRYWQKRFARGEVPGGQQIILGKSKRFVVPKDQFEEWWATQIKEITPCHEVGISTREVKSGGVGSSTKASDTRHRLKQRTRQLREIASQSGLERKEVENWGEKPRRSLNEAIDRFAAKHFKKLKPSSVTRYLVSIERLTEHFQLLKQDIYLDDIGSARLLELRKPASPMA